MRKLTTLPSNVQQYLLITGNYWAFTLTDGALRMLVILYFHGLGYKPLDIALLFVFYEAFGVITNLIGGWLGAHIGLNRIMNAGLFLQIIALSMLLIPETQLTVLWVMAAQALSGIAKDLNKMSAKSAIRLLVSADAQDTLFRWVAVLTGSKNTLKGAGFFLGGALLTALGFHAAIVGLAFALFLVWIISLVFLKKELGKSKAKPKFTDILSKSNAINTLSATRMFLFGSRDIWFVVALPVYLSSTFNWDHWHIGGYLAAWVIGYGIVQSCAPYIIGKTTSNVPDGKDAFIWALALCAVPACIALVLKYNWQIENTLLIGLLVYGIFFAINSSLHSYLIVSYADEDNVSLDVGFYYMANAMGRLIGTILSGWLFQTYGLAVCLWTSAGFVLLATLLSLGLPKHSATQTI